MKTIIHLSDLHFGTQKKGVAHLLAEDIKQIPSDLIIITGDFTQRALTKQYQSAQLFLNSLKPKKILCIPGNHDIALYNLFERFFLTFYQYQKYICADLNPTFDDNDLAVFGITSATPYRAYNGVVGQNQIERMIEFFKNKTQQIKIVFMHHNLIKSERHRVVYDAEKLIKSFVECKINLILSGHLHYPHIEVIKEASYPMFSITAGTPTSWRLCGYPNCFNVINLDKDKLTLIIREFDGKSFTNITEKQFQLFSEK